MKIIGLHRPSPLLGALFISALLVLFTLFLLFAMPAHAQDTTPSPDVTVDAPTPEATLIIDQPADQPIVDVPDSTAPVFNPPSILNVLNTLLLALFTAFSSAVTSPITAPIVSQLKKLPFFQAKNDDGTPKWSGDHINLLVAIILSGVVWTAAAFGFQGQIDTALKLLFAILPIVTGVGGNFVGNQTVYSYGVKKKIPVLNYARTPEPVGTAVGQLVVQVPGVSESTRDVVSQAIKDALSQRNSI